MMLEHIIIIVLVLVVTLNCICADSNSSIVAWLESNMPIDGDPMTLAHVFCTDVQLSASECSNFLAEVERKAGQSDRIYSSFHCMSGNQMLDDWNQFYFSGAAESHIKNRVCKLHNVCWEKDHLRYHVHPEEIRAPSRYQLFKHEVVEEIFGQGSELFKVTDDILLTKAAHFLDTKTSFLANGLYGYNFAHALTDVLLPTMTAMEIFNISAQDSQVVYSNCVPPTTEITERTESYYRQCDANYLQLSRLLWGADAGTAINVESWNNEEFCMKEVVVGHGFVFKMQILKLMSDNIEGMLMPNAPDRYFGMVLRKARDAVVRNLIDPVLNPPSSLRILVIPKGSSKNNITVNPITSPMLCADVQDAVSAFSIVEVRCMSNSSKSLEEEISHVRHFPLIVAEAGTLSYFSVFGHDGTVLLSIGDADRMKELHTLAYGVHFRAIFMAKGDSDFRATLRYCMHLAATNFDIELTNYLLTQ